jgi:hypothetical protein
VKRARIMMSILIWIIGFRNTKYDPEGRRDIFDRY